MRWDTASTGVSTNLHDFSESNPFSAGYIMYPNGPISNTDAVFAPYSYDCTELGGLNNTRQ